MRPNQECTVTRWIRGYDKYGDSLRVEFRIPDQVALRDLQEVVGTGNTDPLYDAYPLNAQQLRQLQGLTGHALQVGECEYFLEADAEAE